MAMPSISTPNRSCVSFSNTNASRNRSVMLGTVVPFSNALDLVVLEQAVLHERVDEVDAVLGVHARASARSASPPAFLAAASAGSPRRSAGRTSSQGAILTLPSSAACRAFDFSSSMPRPCTTASMMASGRTAQPGRVHVDGDGLVHAADHVVAVVEDAGRARADAARDDHLGLDHLVVDLLHHLDVLLVHAARDEEDVGVLGVARVDDAEALARRSRGTASPAPRCRSRCSWSRRSG